MWGSLKSMSGRAKAMPNTLAPFEARVYVSTVVTLWLSAST